MQVEILRVSEPIVYIFSPLAQMVDGRQALYEQVEVCVASGFKVRKTLKKNNSTAGGPLSLGALSSRL